MNSRLSFGEHSTIGRQAPVAQTRESLVRFTLPLARAVSRTVVVILAAFLAFTVRAQQADLEINTPAVSSLKASMQARHSQLEPYYASGAVGLTKDGLVTVRDANAIPLAQRQAVSAAVADENKDRNALYREIARANNHPEWENDVRATFAQRWISKAQPGWYVQNASGAWLKK